MVESDFNTLLAMIVTSSPWFVLTESLVWSRVFILIFGRILYQARLNLHSFTPYNNYLLLACLSASLRLKWLWTAINCPCPWLGHPRLYYMEGVLAYGGGVGLWRVWSAGCRLQVRVAGHCFTMTETTQTLAKMLTSGLNIIFWALC